MNCLKYMNASYTQLIKTVFPCAVIVTDQFHIVQHITRSFNQLRVKIMNQFRANDSEEQKKYRRLKRYWKLLLKDSDTVHIIGFLKEKCILRILLMSY